MSDKRAALEALRARHRKGVKRVESSSEGEGGEVKQGLILFSVHFLIYFPVY